MALHEGVVYGPIRSRRLGRSLGINLTPANTKLCSFNCTYCQYGWSTPSRVEDRRPLESWPSPQVVVRAVSRVLRTFAAQGESIDRLTLAGHGEPTMHPRFAEVVDALRALRDKVVPGVPIAVLSNASTLERADVRSALATIDERYMKLDAGDTKILRAVNGSTMPIETLVQGLSTIKNIVVQAMFVKDRTGRIDNTTDLAVINWVVALQRIKPAAVHIYTIDRAPAWPYLQAVSAGRLQEIANQVSRAGFACEVFTRSEHPSSPINE
jgi:wyosine [tRNA(Phe)-imidazoG37] synthetase (radical SAM superfamily)